MNKLGYVYFLLDDKLNEVKIGWSSFPARRAANIRCVMKRPHLRIIGCVRAYQWAENVIHLRFNEYYIGREWFRMNDEIKTFIQESGVLRVELILIVWRSPGSRDEEESNDMTMCMMGSNFDKVATRVDGSFWRSHPYRRERFDKGTRDESIKNKRYIVNYFGPRSLAVDEKRRKSFQPSPSKAA